MIYLVPNRCIKQAKNQLKSSNLRLGGSIVTLVVIFLSVSGITASSIPAARGNSVSISWATCTPKVLEANIQAAGQVVSLKDAISFAQSTQQYRSDTAGFTTSFQGANDGWSFDSSCQVSWTSIAVNFLMKSTNGSKYNLAITENPKLGIVMSAIVAPALYAAITPTCSVATCRWSGYAVSGNSGNTQQIYEAQARWYQPTVSAPPVSQASCADISTDCNVTPWVGLVDSANPNSATIVQTGVFATYVGNRVPAASYLPWTEIYCSTGCQSMIQCPSNDVVTAGDQMYGDVQNQYAHDFTTGNNYYITLTDFNANWACVPSTNPQSVSFTPHYAAFIAERVNPFYHLAQFPDFSFLNCALFINNLDGVYPEYNSGYGFGAYMYSNFYQETSTGVMTPNPGSNYASFPISWLSSSGS
jgi:hypothetical protein